MTNKTEPKGIVVLAFGPQPVDAVTKMAKIAGKDAVLCTKTAQMAGAMMAFGTLDALRALQDKLLLQAVADAKTQAPGLSMQAQNWLASGERGLSSESIFQHLTGVITLKDHHQGYLYTPSDPGDLRRCRLLLEQVPDLQAMFKEKMPSASDEWAKLVEAWDRICALMDEETPEWRTGKGRASRTYEAMKEIRL